VQILGISFDTPEANAAFAKKFNYNFPLLCDTDRKIGLAYGAADDPSATSAKRISYLIGADGKVKNAYGSVKPAEHPTQVLRDVASRP